MARAREMLASVGMAGRGEDYPRALSGGELQRVAIARALVHRPSLLLADEPTGNLDPETATRILELFAKAVRDAGAATLLVTHSDVAASVADRTLTLTRGGLGQWPRALTRWLGSTAARWMILGEWRAHPGRVIVAMIAIAVGVALGFAVHLINASALNEFARAVASVNGDADLQVRAASPLGFDEALYPKLARLDGIASASPVVELRAVADAGGRRAAHAARARHVPRGER